MPFEQVRLEGWLLEVDAEATRRAYREAQLIDLCGCQGCRNYGAFARSLPTPILGVFSQLGIDPAREGEVWVYVHDESGQHLYGGFYPLVGSIVARPESLSFFPCSDVFYLYFTTGRWPGPCGFPAASAADGDPGRRALAAGGILPLREGFACATHADGADEGSGWASDRGGEGAAHRARGGQPDRGRRCVTYLSKGGRETRPTAIFPRDPHGGLPHLDPLGCGC